MNKIEREGKKKMSKSIYEEAIEDLYYVIPVGYPKDMIGKTIQTKRLLDFVKQAQKQEKLLELYKELSNYVCEQCYAHEFPKINRLKILIKELENE